MGDDPHSDLVNHPTPSKPLQPRSILSSPLRTKTSQYTLRSITASDTWTEPVDDLEGTVSLSEHVGLFGSFSKKIPGGGQIYGSTSSTSPLASVPGPFQSRRTWLSDRPLLRAGFGVAGIFLISLLFLGGTLWLALPRVEQVDRPKLRVPKSFAQLQDLNELLQKYRTIYPFRTLLSFVATYLFLQAFSIPGSMYLSILAGAAWGMPYSLPLCCSCIATGATLCYLMSAAFGPALLAMPKWKDKVDRLALKVEAQRANLTSFLIVLRIAPFPPHWVVNIVCPHLSIGIWQFWISTFSGVMGVTVIHTTIGGGLDQMTSAKDFKLISWRNFLGLFAIVVAVLIPVGLRYYWRDELDSVAQAEREAGERQHALEGIIVGSGATPVDKGKAISQLVLLDDSDSDLQAGDEQDPILWDEEDETPGYRR